MGRLGAIRSPLGAAPSRLTSVVLRDDRRQEGQQGSEPAWRKWYKTARWQKLAWTVKVEAGFTCQRPGCGVMTLQKYGLAVDHKVAHHGDPNLFWDRSNLQCLCKHCHDSEKQRQERAGR